MAEQLPSARLEPRNLAERVTQTRGSMADARKRFVAKYNQELSANEALLLGTIGVVGGGALVILRHLLF